MTDAAWGSTLTLGVEEELMIVDAETLSQRPVSSEVIPRVRTDRGEVKHELFESIVELNSGICATPQEAVGVLRELRRETARAAGEIGCTIAAAGSHPFDVASEQRIADEPHYRTFVEYAGPVARRQGVQGLHVHVGMPDAETCLRVLELVLPWLPVLLGLSANSPWWEGRLSGLYSTRAEILGLLPRHGAPPRFESWAEWEDLIARFVGAGVVDNYGALHWDIRPHPRYGTLEFRVPDQPTELARTGQFVEFIHALAGWALDQPLAERLPGDRAVYEQNRWAAARGGAFATLIRPDRSGAATVSKLYVELGRTIGSHPLDAASCEGEAVDGFDDPREAMASIVARSLAFDA